MDKVKEILLWASENEPGCDQGFYRSLLYAVTVYRSLEKISPKSKWIFRSRLRESIQQVCFNAEQDSHNIRSVFNDIPEDEKI